MALRRTDIGQEGDKNKKPYPDMGAICLKRITALKLMWEIKNET